MRFISMTFSSWCMSWCASWCAFVSLVVRPPLSHVLAGAAGVRGTQMHVPDGSESTYLCTEPKTTAKFDYWIDEELAATKDSSARAGQGLGGTEIMRGISAAGAGLP